jgi:hypothetical protein
MVPCSSKEGKPNFSKKSSTILSQIRRNLKMLNYPVIKKQNSYQLHGQEIQDPFLALEDPDGSESKKFVQEQNDLFQNYLSASKLRSKFATKLTSLMV